VALLGLCRRLVNRRRAFTRFVLEPPSCANGRDTSASRLEGAPDHGAAPVTPARHGQTCQNIQNQAKDRVGPEWLSDHPYPGKPLTSTSERCESRPRGGSSDLHQGFEQVQLHLKRLPSCAHANLAPTLHRRDETGSSESAVEAALWQRGAAGRSLHAVKPLAYVFSAQPSSNWHQLRGTRTVTFSSPVVSRHTTTEFGHARVWKSDLA